MVEIKKLSELYPQYYKSLPPGVDPSEIDTYVLNLMFPVDDPTGTILHARKKLLIPGVRSGGKSMLKDIKEARDTLNRYIALMDVPEEENDGGWIQWAGGDKPPNRGVHLDIRFKSAGVLYRQNPHRLRWGHDGSETDILFYRVSEK